MNSITKRTAILTLEKQNFVRMGMMEDIYLELKDMQDENRTFDKTSLEFRMI